MTNTDLLILADRVEGLSGPCRETDAEISATLRLATSVPDWAKTWAGEWRPTVQGSVVMMQADGTPGPHFVSKEWTGSLDIAASLVPEGKHFGCGSKDATCKAWAWCGDSHGLSILDEQLGSAATPALALTAASIRSIAANQEKDGE